ncbi:MAG: ArsR/SmtB family transcription factor [Anaerolineaceae bacterium]
MNTPIEFFENTKQLAKFFDLLGQPSRLQIVLAIGSGDALVCQLCAISGNRQAYISQQLMELRKGGLVITRRQGRNIYYRLAEPQFLDIVHEIAKIMGITIQSIELPSISLCDYKLITTHTKRNQKESP